MAILTIALVWHPSEFSTKLFHRTSMVWSNWLVCPMKRSWQLMGPSQRHPASGSDPPPPSILGSGRVVLWITLLLWKDRVLATRAMAHWLESQQHQSMYKHKSMTSSLTHPSLYCRLSTKMSHLVAGCAMVFCLKNILELSMRFHGDYLKRYLLTHRVSQILYLIQLISEIMYITANGLFSTLLTMNNNVDISNSPQSLGNYHMDFLSLNVAFILIL